MPDRRLLSCGPYQISRIPAQPLPFEQDSRTLRYSQLLCWTTWTCHCIGQAVFIVGLSSPSKITKACLWTGLFAEICLSFSDLALAVDFIIHSFRQQSEGPRPHYRLLGDSVPHVDVFITCCGEPVDVLVNSIKAAATQDYPVSRYNVIVLDDGHDEKLQSAVSQLNSKDKGLARIFYRSRRVKPGARSFFKSGNLNYGIAETAQISAGEYIASIDADVIVSSDWLRNMLPHLLLEPKLGLATCPQNYYNVPAGDPLAQQIEFDMWNTIFEPLHDHVGEAICMGSGFVVRRKALNYIGGWPLTDTGEDYMCSTKLVENGWKVALVRENLQQGTAPSSFESFRKQRLRWIDAAVDVHRSNGWYLPGGFGQNVTLVDKISSILFALRDLSSVSTSLSLILLPASMLSLILISHEIRISPTWHALLWSTTILTLVSSKWNDWIIYNRMGLTGISNLRSLEVWFAPYGAARCLQLLLPFRSNVANFFVTGSYICATNERSRSKRTPLLQRLKASGIPIHICYTAACTLVLAYCLSEKSSIPPSESGLVITVALMPGYAVKLAACIWKASTPVRYMITPPNVIDWQELVEDDSNGVLRPKKVLPPFVDATGSGLGRGQARLWRDAFEILVLCLCL